MPLNGHNILIVEAEIGPFVVALQHGLEACGADSLVARGPEEALVRAREFSFTAVIAHRDLAEFEDQLSLPTLLYSSNEAEREADAIVARLKRRLSI